VLPRAAFSSRVGRSVAARLPSPSGQTEWLLGRQAYPNGRWEEEKEIRGIFSRRGGSIIPVLEPNIRMTPPNQTHPQGSVETLIS